MIYRLFATLAFIIVSFTVSSAYSQGLRVDFVVLQVLKNGVPLTGQVAATIQAGGLAIQESMSNIGQIRMECNGAAPLSMAVEMRDKGAVFEIMTLTDTIKVDVIAKDFVAQQLPADGNFPVCVKLVPAVQATYRNSVSVPLLADGPTNIKQDLGNGYELVGRITPLR
jgi:hypothetical protein